MWNGAMPSAWLHSLPSSGRWLCWREFWRCGASPTPEQALSLLDGEEELSDPFLLTDMQKACDRILQAIDQEETIVVFGDYDVDGVTATALLYQHLKGMGARVKCMLPSREGDGYGLSKNAIQSIHDKGYQLIITVDNGIAAVEEAAFAASLGVDLIVTDHHLPHDVLPGGSSGGGPPPPG